MKIFYDRFYSYNEIIDCLNGIKAEDNNDLLSVETYGVSREGRNIPIAIVNDKITGHHTKKPAYYIQANVHSIEMSGTTVALHFINYLINNEEAKEILKNVAFYIVPRINVDGAEYAITKGSAPRSRYEENGAKNAIVPQDVNGDGKVLYMRWEDPLGPFVELDGEPRMMVRCTDGDYAGKKRYQMVREGFVRDYDGGALRSGTREIDFNRNYAAEWSSRHLFASKYPFEEPELRAVAEFTTSHTNIFAGIDLHNGSNGILRPSITPDAQINEEDLYLIIGIGEMAEKITGFPLIHEIAYRPDKYPLSTLYGNSNEWAYKNLGISHYVIELGNGFNTAGYTTREIFTHSYADWDTVFRPKALKVCDEKGYKVFEDWAPFEHPQLGKVEIGGLYENNAFLLDIGQMEQIAPKVSEFFIAHAKMHPLLKISDAEITAVSKDIYRVRCRMSNIGSMSTKIMASGNPCFKVPAKVELKIPETAEFVSREQIFEINAPEQPTHFEWFVKSDNDITGHTKIVASHPKAGICTIIV